MLFVTATTMTAGGELCGRTFPAMIEGGRVWTGVLNLAMTIFVMTCVGALLLMAAARWLAVLRGLIPVRSEAAPADGAYAEKFDGAAADAIQAKEDRVL
jgi:hypothetical protein